MAEVASVPVPDRAPVSVCRGAIAIGMSMSISVSAAVVARDALCLAPGTFAAVAVLHIGVMLRMGMGRRDAALLERRRVVSS